MASAVRLSWLAGRSGVGLEVVWLTVRNFRPDRIFTGRHGERRNRVCRGPPRRVAPYSPLGRRAWWPARCRWRSGEYVSVSSQRDSEKSLLARDRRELREMPAAELDELAAIYEAKGVSPQTAAQVAAELTAHDALAAHVDVELRLDPDDLANPLQAAAASAASFTVGSLLPCSLFGCHQRRFGFPSPSSPC